MKSAPNVNATQPRADREPAPSGLGATFWQHLVGAPLQQRWLNALDVRTRVVEAGAGPPLVFLHGIASHLEAHLTVLPALARRFRVILYDMPGRGWSDKPDRPYTIDYLSEHLVALLDALGVERAHLSGQSLGGWVAAWTAASRPERVATLVLNNPGNVRSRPEALARVRESNCRLMSGLTEEEVRARLAWLFHREDAITDEHVAIRYAMYAQPGFARAMENISAILDPEVRQRYTWDPCWCARIEAPTILIWSRHNPLATLDDMEELAGWIPRAALVTLEDSAEFPQMEQPERFIAIHEALSERMAPQG